MQLKLKKNFPFWVILDNLLASPSKIKEITGYALSFCIPFSFPIVTLFMTDNNLILAFSSISFLVIMEMMKVYTLMSMRNIGCNIVGRLLLTIPYMFWIILEHLLCYMPGILLKNRRLAIYSVFGTLSCVSAMFGINNQFVEIFYNEFESYEFQTELIVTLVLVLFTILVACINVGMLIFILNKKCGNCGEYLNRLNPNGNTKIYIFVCALTSIINFYYKYFSFTKW